MKKHIVNEKTGIGYTLVGDYYLPNIVLPAEEEKPVGIWGRRHLRYIKRSRRVLYMNLLISGKLNGYLNDIDKRAEDMFFRLVKEYADRRGVTERLKAEEPLAWVKKMNGIRNCVKEIVEDEIIYN